MRLPALQAPSPARAAPRGERPQAGPLGPRLARVGAGAARMSRLLHDERLQRWLAHVCEVEQVHVAVRRVEAPQVVFDLQANEGRLRLALPREALPVAMRAAVAIKDGAAACEVAGLLAAPVFERLSPLLSGVRLLAVEHAEGRQGFDVAAGDRRALVCGADDALMAHLSDVLREIPAAVAEWGALEVRARVRLMVRRWTQAVLASLRPGDVVLAAAGERQLLVVGTGFCMQAPAQASMDSGVQVVGETKMSQDELAADAPGADVEALELPVAFEIDSARLSLAELAGIRPGYVVELDTPVEAATVRLVCHGQVVGHGQLVAVGEQLGVRISRMGLKHGVAAQH
jgi:type III secretion protein Q